MTDPVEQERRRLSKLRESLKQARTEADRQTVRTAIMLHHRALTLALRAAKGK